MLRWLILAFSLVAFSGAVLANQKVVGLSDLPLNAQGPLLPGLHSDVYSIALFNKSGTEVCYPSVPTILQPMCIGVWIQMSGSETQ